MATSAMIQLTAKEFIEKLLSGERDMSNTQLPAETALDQEDSYGALLAT